MDQSTQTLYDFINDPLVSSILSLHPNDLASTGFSTPSSWSSWLPWASQISDDIGMFGPKWLILIRRYIREGSQYAARTTAASQDIQNAMFVPDPHSSSEATSEIPRDLSSLIDKVRLLQINRTMAPIALPPTSVRPPHADHTYGMSPKKVHEVTRMTDYISSLMSTPQLQNVRHVVDVGSGQGYLSRALENLGMHVLALDSNQVQTSGAERWQVKALSRRQKKQQKAELGEPDEQMREASLDWPRFSAASRVMPARTGSITQKTIHITPSTLQSSIQEWILTTPRCGITNGPKEGDQGGDALSSATQKEDSEAVPVLLVALHACGSLTPDIVRTFLNMHRAQRDTRNGESAGAWKPAALVVVGCCYNLMSPQDFPLSNDLRRKTKSVSETSPRLPLSYLQLAAQVPSQWLRNPSSSRDASLAIKKVVYRAMMQPILQSSIAQRENCHEICDAAENDDCVCCNEDNGVDQCKIRGTGETPENRRLGKLRDSAYDNWGLFLDRAGAKMGLNLESMASRLTGPEYRYLRDERVRRQLESQLEVLHVLRCILGSLIESLIFLDRLDWIKESLGSQPWLDDKWAEQGRELQERAGLGMHDAEGKFATLDARLFNMFDQATGSGRNVAITISPK